MSKELKFKSLDEVMEHLEQLSNSGEKNVTEYRNIMEQLTGHPLGRQINAIDVVKIVRKVFGDKLQ